MINGNAATFDQNAASYCSTRKQAVDDSGNKLVNPPRQVKRQYIFPCCVSKVSPIDEEASPSLNAKMLEGSFFTLVVDEVGVGLTNVEGLQEDRDLRQSKFFYMMHWPYLDIVGWQVRSNAEALIRVK